MARAGVSVIVGLACAVLLSAMVLSRGAHPPTGRALASVSPSAVFIPPPNAGFYDADIVDGSHGWLLFRTCVGQPGPAASPARGNSPQQAPRCQNSVARTQDGGVSWFRAGDVGPTFTAPDGGAPRSIHFLSTADGFVYGDKVAFATHDGGYTWSDAGLPFYVLLSIVGRGHAAWAVSAGPTVQRSVDGGLTWSQPQTLRPETGYGWPNAVAFGDSGLIVWGRTAADITHDGGASWKSISTPCTGNVKPVIATADGKEIWSACIEIVPHPEPNAGNSAPDVVLSGMFVSEDMGESWAGRPRPDPTLLPAGCSGCSAGNFPGSFVATGKGTALINTWGGLIFATHDAGLTWTQVGPKQSDLPKGWGFLYLRLGTPDEIWAILSWTVFWASHDGGKTWSPMAPVTRSGPA